MTDPYASKDHDLAQQASDAELIEKVAKIMEWRWYSPAQGADRVARAGWTVDMARDSTLTGSGLIACIEGLLNNGWRIEMLEAYGYYWSSRTQEIETEPTLARATLLAVIAAFGDKT